MYNNFLGIDISAATFDVALLDTQGRCRQETFSNSTKGFQSLARWLRHHNADSLHACLEATGRYGLALAHFLYESHIPVSVVNPACIKAFAQSELRRAKTDRLDAQGIARFSRAMRPSLWQPPTPEIEGLQALVYRLEDLQQMAAQESCRLKAPANSPLIQASLQRNLASLKEQIAALRKAIREHFRQHPQLAAQRDLLLSIPGIGEITATALLAENLSQRNCTTSRQMAAYAGLVPSIRRSGSSVRGKSRLSKSGNRRLRRALYFPALAAGRLAGPLRNFAQRLLAAGKPKMVVIGALMRKLICLAFAILRSGRPYDPNYKPIRP